MTTYSFRDHAIQFEIIDAIEAGGINDARAEFDIDAIADEIIGDYNGFACKVDEESFWEIVADHHVSDGDHRIIWDESDDNGNQTARLMQWSENENGFIEIDSETIVSSEEVEPYDAAKTALEARHDLHGVTGVWCH